ncbi:UV-B-induced protein At3g17800, chloroplastic [Malania oleifera]|uniref:UV-B-induced protein At3g17800, chloroplastic n=1 Tax=Malania oleifera TaxID=397392 RepID=UPI0025ADA7C2|nr:UV-B-induced protein At3g17800, chloroplastic [Malania oleifera]
MEAAAVLRSSFGTCRPPRLAARSGVSTANGTNFVRFGAKFPFSYGWMKQYPSASHSKLGCRRITVGSRKSCPVSASSSSETGQPSAPIAPLQLESPIGQFLSQILINHPHLVMAAVEQQLEQLQTDRDAGKQEEPSASGTELVLYRRIAEVKANERRKVLEEILYALVVQKFMDAGVSLISTISTPSSSDSQVDTWPSQDEKLVRLHSPEAYEMIQNHLALILGNRLGDSTSVAQISKLRVGQVYAASVMYGYFLKRVDQRFQLEKTMKILPHGSDEEEMNFKNDEVREMMPDGGESSVRTAQSDVGVSSWSGGISTGGFGYGIKPCRLRTYVMSFDAETLQRYATIRSKEAVSIIEKHTEALFGRPEIVLTPQGTIDSSKDELIKISFGGLKRLILEAVTFGSFLRDVETYVDMRYHFVMN